MIGESPHRRPQGRGSAVDTALPTPVREPGVLVETEGQALAHEKLLQGAGQRPSRASRPAGAL